VGILKEIRLSYSSDRNLSEKNEAKSRSPIRSTTPFFVVEGEVLRRKKKGKNSFVFLGEQLLPPEGKKKMLRKKERALPQENYAPGAYGGCPWKLPLRRKAVKGGKRALFTFDSSCREGNSLARYPRQTGEEFRRRKKVTFQKGGWQRIAAAHTRR